jgi:hypothetical protein
MPAKNAGGASREAETPTHNGIQGAALRSNSTEHDQVDERSIVTQTGVMLQRP